MGRGHVYTPLTLGWYYFGDYADILATVLREIEEEDSLWHQKASAQPTQQEQKQEEVPAPKEPVIPAEGAANQEPPTDSRSRRKLNFF